LRLTFFCFSRFINVVRLTVLFINTLVTFLMVSSALAVEVAPRISDREIVERLTKVEEGQRALQAEMHQLREDVNTQIKQLREDVTAQVQHLREDMRTQGQQLRDDMNAHYDRMYQLILGLLAAFTGITLANIGIVVWDRRSVVKPFESKVKVIEDELAQNRQTLHSFLDAMRTLGQTDEKVADVLRKFHLF
jgi:seryl-tRNA synthetase